MASVSILICTRNRSQHLHETLECFRAVHSKIVDVEICVIDNGSTDQTNETLQVAMEHDSRVRMLSEPLAGQTLARNLGMRIANGDILLWTDDDVRVPADWIDRMIAPILRDESDVTCGAIRIAAHLVRPWQTERHLKWMAAYGKPEAGTPPTVIGANMAFHRRVLKQVPAFDPELGPGRLGYGDETLFSLQLAEAGFRIAFVADAEVEHHFDKRRLSRQSWLAAAEAYGQSNAYLHHHWYHGAVRSPRAQIATTVLKRWHRRLWLGRPAEEGISLDEMGLRCYEHFLRGFLAHRQNPRNYALKGLVKIRGEKALVA